MLALVMLLLVRSASHLVLAIVVVVHEEVYFSLAYYCCSECLHLYRQLPVDGSCWYCLRGRNVRLHWWSSEAGGGAAATYRPGAIWTTDASPYLYL